MSEKDIAFKAKLDAMEEQARLDARDKINESMDYYDGYVAALEDMKRAYIDVESGRDA